MLRHLGELTLAHARKSSLVNLLGWLGLALALDDRAEPTPEERLLRDLAIPAVVGRYGDCLQVYADECEAAGAPSVEELIERLGGARLMERIRTQRPAAERYPTSVARLEALIGSSAAPTLTESIDLLLGPGGAVAERRVAGRRPASQSAHAALDQGTGVLPGLRRRRGGRGAARASTRWTIRICERFRRRGGCCTSA